MSSSDDTYAGLIRCPKIEPIEGKDRIGVINLSGKTVIVRKDQFNEGDMGIYIYVDSVMPVEMVEHYNLERLKNGRVKAMKMAGVTSQGLFLPLTYPLIRKDAPEFTNLASELNVLHWKPEVKLYKGQTPHINARNWPSWLNVMKTSNLDRPEYFNAFDSNTNVVVTEKIHGMNATFAYIRPWRDELLQKDYEAEFQVMSRQVNFKRDRPLAQMNDDVNFQTNAFYMIADRYDLENKLKAYSDMYSCDVIIRGELFGKRVQDLEYGMDDIDFRIFDVQFEKGIYKDWFNVEYAADRFGLKTVPVLYEGKYNYDKIKEIAEGNSSIAPNQISEGVVVRTLREEQFNTGERKMLKLRSSRYLARDDSKEVAE